MKLAVVLNRRAGTLLRHRPEDAAREVRALFAAAGAQADTVVTGRQGFRAALARAAASDADAMVVGGGDGTVRMAAQAALDSGKALGVLPLGTLNLFARDLGMPLDLKPAIAALGAGAFRMVDVAEVNGKVFLCLSGLGFFVHMSEARETRRTGSRIGKWVAFATALWTALARAPEFDVAIEAGGPTRHFVTRAVVVTNNLFEDVPGMLPGRTRLDRGELVLHVDKNRSHLAMLRIALKAARGGWHDDSGVETMRVPALTIASRRRHVRVASDGEIDRLETPLRYRIRPGALRVLVPRPRDDAAR